MAKRAKQHRAAEAPAVEDQASAPPRLEVGPALRNLNVKPDLPDIRDRIYQPRLTFPKAQIIPSLGFDPRDQGATSRCTGFAVAHAIDVLLESAGGSLDDKDRVSAWMLYEIAKLNDEWEGTGYEGSSIRGALSGFYRNGVCSADLAPDASTDAWRLTYERNKDARNIRLGAYYRLEPDLTDYHSALNEVGVIVASAQIHDGWTNPDPGTGSIKPGARPLGGHAFAIVGYDETGFFVLNSWGSGWGTKGVAHWSYQDWATTIMDAWVLQIGVKAPSAHIVPLGRSLAGGPAGWASKNPPRDDIVGHYVNIDDGLLVESGSTYFSPKPDEMQETVERLTLPSANDGKGYSDLVLYAHGGLNTIEDDAARIGVWKRNEIFLRNRIYNFHLMWGTGGFEELFDDLPLPWSFRGPVASRWPIFDPDQLLEVLLRTGGGQRIWRNIKKDAQAAFSDQPPFDGGFRGLRPLFEGLAASGNRPRIHLVGHSAGAILIGHLLSSLKRFGSAKPQLQSIHLMAPACTVDFFAAHYAPFLSGRGAVKDKVYLYNLSDQRELSDRVGFGKIQPYGKSLLYLVSRAFEEAPETPLAGMARYGDHLREALTPAQRRKLKIDLAEDRSTLTRSTTHGGFDNDAATLATIMTRILENGGPAEPPLPHELTDY